MCQSNDQKKKKVAKITVAIVFKGENQIEPKRKEERYTYNASEYTYVEFKISSGSEKLKFYTLKVNDCASGGLGILITEKNVSLIKNVREGDIIHNVIFSSPWTVATMDFTVTHKTKIESGKYKGSYIMGLRSEKIIENYKPA